MNYKVGIIGTGENARDSNVLLTDGYEFRYNPQHMRVKEIIDSGSIGEIKSVQCTFSSSLVRFTPLPTGGTLENEVVALYLTQPAT